MRVRPVHLATLLLLLATFGIGEGQALGHGRLRVGAAYASAAVLAQDSAGVPQTARGTRAVASAPAPHNTIVHYSAAWTMRPPAAHSVHVHAVTASRI